MVVVAGFLQGIFAVPMKYARKWRYENVWLAFTLMALVVFPWVFTLATVPHIAAIYRLTPTATFTAIVVFGLCWGIGSALTGLGLNMLGIGLGIVIILGISAAAGSLIPLLVLDPNAIHTHQGHLFLLGTSIMLLGIICGARAGFLRDASQRAVTTSERRENSSFFADVLGVVESERANTFSADY